MKGKPKAVEQLAGVGWDFARAKTGSLTHGLHPYPARMVPDIATHLVRVLSEPRDVVFDPFCGSGTTLVEALRQNRHAVGLDVNPFALLLTRVKTTPIDPDLLTAEWNALKRRLRGTSARSREKRAGEVRHVHLDLNYWYKPYVLRDLSFLKRLLDDSYPGGQDPVADFLRIAFVKTAREVSNHRPSEFKRWRKAPKELESHRPRVVPTFMTNVEEAIPMMAEYYDAGGTNVTCRVLQGDARRFRLGSRASLIVTSPPYGDSATTVAYGQFSSFALEWLDMDVSPADLDGHPMGSSPGQEDDWKPPRSLRGPLGLIERRDSSRARQVVRFFSGMAQAIAGMERSLGRSGYCCLVVGNRTVKGVKVQTDRILVELAEKEGLKLSESLRRRVLNKVLPYATTPRNASGSAFVQPTLRSESILVFEPT